MQFDHLSEMYFAGYNYDMAERALHAAAPLDSDLDMFSAAIGLTRTALNTHVKEEGVCLWPEGMVKYSP